jgi:hypothetical protein
MGSRMWLGIGFLGLMAAIGAPARGEDRDPFDKAATTVNGAATTPASAQQVAGKIASELNTTCACSTFSAESVSAQRAQTGWGWGELLIADRLALAISQQSKISFNTALGQVMAGRQHPAGQQPAGWGAIAKANNLNVGQLVGGITKSADAVANAGNNAGKGQGQGNAAKAGAGGSDNNPGVGVGAGHGAGGAGEGQGGGHGGGASGGQGGGGGNGGAGGGGAGGGGGGGGKK